MDELNNDKLLTIKEVQDRLRLHYNTIQKYITQGLIPVVRISRSKRLIKEQDLEDFIKKHTGVYKS